jgi:hypothetical protein
MLILIVQLKVQKLKTNQQAGLQGSQVDHE